MPNPKLFQIRDIAALPPNFDEFISENAIGLRTLYGPAAEAEYRSTVREHLQTAINAEILRATVAFDGARAAAMTLSTIHDSIGRINHHHVLRDYAGQGADHALIEDAVASFRHDGVDAILSECVPFCDIDESPVFARLGFIERRRAVMRADLPLIRSAPAMQPEIAAITHRQREAVAATLMRAYEGHPSRVLHPEVLTESRAMSFVKTALSGGYGATDRDYSLYSGTPKSPDAIILCCRVAPDVGFVLHVAVRPECQNQGLGAQLIAAAARHFTRTGLRKIALGVSCDNPAIHLYERLGFEVVHHLNSYAWWRETPR